VSDARPPRISAVPDPDETEPKTAEPQEQPDRAHQTEQVQKHAPPDWRDRFDTDALLDAIAAHAPIQMFVMAADIRGSTMLMKEAIRFERFAATMDRFVSTVRQGIGHYGGWFDRFTGDGFLAYWVVQTGHEEVYDERFVEAAGNIVHTARTLTDLFHRRVLEDFRANSRNLPGNVGLSIGLDAGPGYLVTIARELTVVGPPVVGAVRMVTAATEPQEILANVFLGERLAEEREGVYAELGMEVARERRPTKEYPGGQEVYALRFDGGDTATA
jgi:class 3 adenylate cyclase